MSVILTNVAEFRKGKGGKNTRFVPQTFLSYSIDSSKKLTPNEISLRRLTGLMEKQSIDKNTRKYYSSYLIEDDQLRFMNMTILSLVIKYLVDRSNKFDQTEVSFGEFKKYFDHLIKERTEQDKRIVELRLAATFLRYLYHIDLIIKEGKAELESKKKVRVGEVQEIY